MLTKLDSKEKEIIAEMSKEYGVVSDRLSLIEKNISNYEKELNQKIKGIEDELFSEINTYRKAIEELKESSSTLEENIHNIVVERTNEIDKYLQDVKDSFAEEYKRLIESTKEEILSVKAGAEELKKELSGSRDRFLAEFQKSINEAKLTGNKRDNGFKG